MPTVQLGLNRSKHRTLVKPADVTDDVIQGQVIVVETVWIVLFIISILVFHIVFDVLFVVVYDQRGPGALHHSADTLVSARTVAATCLDVEKDVS